jgi:transcription initiation factor TFIIIB Brf1 subunit/transcription initiation factor TFIIB
VLDECNGDFVCTDCGTVSKEQVYKHSDDVNYHIPSVFLNIPLRKRTYETIASIKKEIECIDFPRHIISNIVDLYEKFREFKICRGRIRKGIIGCAIFYACKKDNIQRSILEISKLLQINTFYIHKAKKIFDKFLENENLLIQTTSLESEQFIKRFCNTLNITKQEKYKLISKTKKIIDLKLDIFSNRKATSICATLIIFVGNKLDLKINKIAFCRNVNVSIVTVNKLLRQLKVYNIQIT